VHIEFLVEDRSTEETLCHLLPKILGDLITFDTHSFQGKRDLLSKLPKRLKGYKGIPDDWRIIILVDRDNQDCHFSYQLASYGRNYVNSYQLSVPRGIRRLEIGNLLYFILLKEEA